MKKILISLLMTMILVFGIVGTSMAVDVALNLKATWAANTEGDMKGYYLQVNNLSIGVLYYWNGTGFTTTQSARALLPLTPTQLPFQLPVPTVPAKGQLLFGLNAVDINGNLSEQSTVGYIYDISYAGPMKPLNFTITKP
jgi:hypothetical protein